MLSFLLASHCDVTNFTWKPIKGSILNLSDFRSTLVSKVVFVNYLVENGINDAIFVCYIGVCMYLFPFFLENSCYLIYV